MAPPARRGSSTGARASRPPVEIPSWLATWAAVAWRILVVAAAVVVVGFAFVKLRLVVIPVIAALFIASVLVPPARWLRGKGWPRLAAASLVLVVALGAFAGLVTALGPNVTGQFDELGATVGEGFGEVRNWLTDGPLGLSERQIDRIIDRGREEVQGSSRELARGVVEGVRVVVEFVAGLLLTLVIVFFFVKDGDRMTQWALDLVDEPRRDEIAEIGRRTWTVIGGFIRGSAIVGIVDATLIGIALVILDVPLALTLAVLTFFGAFFPLIGAFVAGLLAALVALVTKGALVAGIVVAVTLVVQEVEGDVVAPLVLGRVLHLHPVVIILSLTAGAVTAGVIGAFLAVPVAGVVASITGYYRERDARTAT